MTTDKKTIYTDTGTFIVDEDMAGDFDPSSMLPEESLSSLPEEAILSVNGERFHGHLKTYTVIKNHVTGKTTVKVVLVTT